MHVKHESQMGQDKEEKQEASRRSSPSGKIVYNAVLKEADEELARTTSALFWSGLAAGLAMGFSLIAEGILRQKLPPATWTPLIAKLGYSFGFMVVILGRQQLFTENTLTPILPLLRKRDWPTFVNVMRLWGVVLAANLIGAMIIGFVAVRSNAFEASLQREFVSLGQEATKYDFVALLLRGVFAGWLIALLVWMLPYAESSHFFVIVIITWLIGVANFSHVIAGAVETFALGCSGEKSWLSIFGRYIAPVLIGNIAGGVTLVAALNHAQVVAGKSGEEE